MAMTIDVPIQKTVDLSTLAGAELPALAALAALEQQAVGVHEAAALHYGLGVYPNMGHEMSIIRLQLAIVKELRRLELDFYRR